VTLKKASAFFSKRGNTEIVGDWGEGWCFCRVRPILARGGKQQTRRVLEKGKEATAELKRTV